VRETCSSTSTTRRELLANRRGKRFVQLIYVFFGIHFHPCLKGEKEKSLTFGTGREGKEGKQHITRLGAPSPNKREKRKV